MSGYQNSVLVGTGLPSGGSAKCCTDSVGGGGGFCPVKDIGSCGIVSAPGNGSKVGDVVVVVEVESKDQIG